MDVALTEEQEMLKKAARDFLEKECPKKLVKEAAEDERGYPRELWQKMADLEWTGLSFPAEYGGAGYSFFDLILLIGEMGHACLPGPFFSTVVLGGLPILFAGDERQKKYFLSRVARGELILTLGWTETSASYDASAISAHASAKSNSYVINGTKLFVSDAHIADYIIYVARTRDSGNPEDGITLFLVDTKTPGIEFTLLKTLGWDKQCGMVFDNVKVPKANVLGQVHEGWQVLQKLMDCAAVAKCADMVGCCEAALEMSVAYAKQRVQFGKPIGSFQAIQHHCANMAIDVDCSRFITYRAAWTISEGLPATVLAAMAKAWVSEASHRVTLLAHQIHGGLGFCFDSDIHLFYRRAKAAAITFGDAAFHHRVIGRELAWTS